jgi:hypothetical protein
MKTALAAVCLMLICGATPTVSDGASTRHEISFCPLHHVPLRVGMAHLVYGKIICPEDYLGAEHYEFAAHTEIFGGCGVLNKIPTRRVLYCPLCRRVEARWEAHPDR